MIKARFVQRFSGIDSDVTVRCDDTTTSMDYFLAYAPSDDAKALTVLDAWNEQNVTNPLDQPTFLAWAQECLEDQSVDGDWELVPTLARPGHRYHDTGWVPPDPGASSTQFTAISVPLRKKDDGEETEGGLTTDNDTYETAIVGGLLVRVDYWLSLWIE